MPVPLSPHLLLALVVLGGGLATLLVAVATARGRGDDLEALLADDAPPVAGDVWRDQLAVPPSRRLLRPLLDAATGAVRRLLPRERLAATRLKLVRAGLSGRVTAEEFVAFQVLVAVLGAGAAALLWDGSPRSLALVLLVVFVAVAAPRGLLDNRRAQRVDRIRRELPDVLDLLAICVEAGQGLEAAMRTVAERDDGVLPAELRHTLREIELGVPRRAALEHLRDRVGVPDVAGLVAALIQADVLGTPLGDVLHVQATEQRRRPRRSQVREQAAKLPVKMLLPLTFLILPALFAVVLGPAMLSITQALG